MGLSHQLGRAYRNTFDRTYGEAIKSHFPKSDLPIGQLFDSVRSVAENEARSLAAKHTAFVNLQTGAYSNLEKDSLLDGKIPKSFLNGDDFTLHREGMKKLMTFLRSSHDQELNDNLVYALANIFNENLRIISDEKHPQSYLPFYINAPSKEAAKLFLENDFVSLKDKLKTFDLHKFLNAPDSYVQEEILDKAYDLYRADKYADTYDVLSSIVNGLHWSDNVGGAVLAATKLQAIIREYADLGQMILHNDYSSSLVPIETDSSDVTD
jgi:hypothetical protein